MKVKLKYNDGYIEVDDEYSDDEIDVINKNEELDDTIEIDIESIKEEYE